MPASSSISRQLRSTSSRMRRRLATNRARTGMQKRRLAARRELAACERNLLAGVDSRISLADEMYLGDGSHYFGVGLSALRSIEEALARAGGTEPRKILDLASGHGRVLRFLVRRFPQAPLTACDANADAVAFCNGAFGATPVVASRPERLRFDERFDLIWCGSLLTHLDAAQTVALLELFAHSTAPGGVAVFTTHGDFVAGRLRRRETDYGLAEEGITGVLRDYERSGFGYADYPGHDGWGLSVSSPRWVRDEVARTAGLQEVYFAARGWDDHQDVFGFSLPSRGATEGR